MSTTHHAGFNINIAYRVISLLVIALYASNTLLTKLDFATELVSLRNSSLIVCATMYLKQNYDNYY